MKSDLNELAEAVLQNRLQDAIVVLKRMGAIKRCPGAAHGDGHSATCPICARWGWGVVPTASTEENNQ